MESVEWGGEMGPVGPVARGVEMRAGVGGGRSSVHAGCRARARARAPARRRYARGRRRRTWPGACAGRTVRGSPWPHWRVRRRGRVAWPRVCSTRACSDGACVASGVAGAQDLGRGHSRRAARIRVSSEAVAPTWAAARWTAAAASAGRKPSCVRALLASVMSCAAFDGGGGSIEDGRYDEGAVSRDDPRLDGGGGSIEDGRYDEGAVSRDDPRLDGGAVPVGRGGELVDGGVPREGGRGRFGGGAPSGWVTTRLPAEPVMMMRPSWPASWW